MKKIIELLQEICIGEDFSGSDDFIADGLIDSADLQRIIAGIESEYGVRIAGTDLMPQNFTSIDSIRELLESYDVKID